MLNTIKKLFVIVFAGLFSGSILVACGGGGGADSGGGATTETQPQVASSEGGGGEGEGEGEGEGGGGGEGAGSCKFALEIVREITPPNTPADQKQITFSTPCQDDPQKSDVFTTNDGIVQPGFADVEGGTECAVKEFVDFYQSQTGVINRDCDGIEQF